MTSFSNKFLTHSRPQTRRQFMATTAAAAGTAALLPNFTQAAAHAGNVFDTPAGQIKVNPIDHASIVLETAKGVIAVDPVGDPSNYANLPKPDLTLITHHHGDHFNAETLAGITQDSTGFVTNSVAAEFLSADHKSRAQTMGNGDTLTANGISLTAIPAYNLTAERQKFHPQGRDNGYVLDLGGFRIYISGDTEDIPEMRALEGIDLAFVCMNLPFTMDAKAAADAVRTFRPKVVYPYHYRGRDGGTQDPAEFAALVGDASEVRMGEWY